MVFPAFKEASFVFSAQTRNEYSTDQLTDPVLHSFLQIQICLLKPIIYLLHLSIKSCSIWFNDILDFVPSCFKNPRVQIRLVSKFNPVSKPFNNRFSSALNPGVFCSFQSGQIEAAEVNGVNSSGRERVPALTGLGTPCLC